MKSKLTTKIIVSLLILIVGFFLIFKKNNSSSHLKIITLSQIIEHSSLDQERDALLSYLKEKGWAEGKNIKIIYHNAQGNLATAAQIAKQHSSLDPSVMIAISTPSAQAALGARFFESTPIVFSAVTNPKAAKLWPVDYVTGVSDQVSCQSQLELIRLFIPTVKKIGIIYNIGESNAVEIVSQFKSLCEKEGLTLVESLASKTSEVSAATQALIHKVDAIYIPNDNTVVSAIHNVVQIAENYKLPVFAGDVGSVEKGALATLGFDRKQLGRKAGELVDKILRGDNALNLPILKDHDLSLFVNTKSLEKYGFSLPQTSYNIHKIEGAK